MYAGSMEFHLPEMPTLLGFSQTGGEGTIRENIIKADLVEGIVAMPSQLFYTTGIPVSLWFLNRAKKQTGKILFVDARNMGTMVTRKLRELSEDDIMKIAKTFEDFEAGTLENEKGYCAIATLEDVAKQDYILTPGRYVGIAENHFKKKWNDLLLNFQICLPSHINWKMKSENN